MLVLSRKPGERIMIGEGKDQIIISLVVMEHGRVKIGIEAPRHVPVYREEVLQQIEAKKKSAG